MFPALSTAAPCAAGSVWQFHDDVTFQIAHHGTGHNTSVFRSSPAQRRLRCSVHSAETFHSRRRSGCADCPGRSHRHVPASRPRRCAAARIRPGPVPRFPHSNRYFPSRENFTTRAPPYPSVTYKSPLAANAMSVGRLNVDCVAPDVPFVPRRMISLPSAFVL